MLALLAKYKLLVIAAALLGALGIGGAGVAAANGALPVAVSALTGQRVNIASVNGKAHARRGADRGLVHGSIITSVNGAYMTYTVDAGRVSAISTSAITLTRLDGQQVTLTITPSTVWGKRHAAPKDPSKLKGRRIIVFSQHGMATQIGTGNGLLKNAVHLDATLYRNGKSRTVQIDRGTVQSASATQISVKRADGVVVTEPVAAKARWTQAPHHIAIQPGQVTVGASVAILTYEGKVIRVRLAAVATS